jgi:hypothetical protein
LPATRIDTLFHAWLPRAMLFFFASLRVAVTQAFVGSVIAETVASNRGIGNLMMIASSNFDVPLVFAGLFVLGGLGVALYVLFSFIEMRVTGWAHRGRLAIGNGVCKKGTHHASKLIVALLGAAVLSSRRRGRQDKIASRSTGSSRASTPGTSGRRRKGISRPRISTW